jgi:4-hydroxy-3-polyprenylbenzoate decarboxylase
MGKTLSAELSSGWNAYPAPHADLREALERIEGSGELNRVKGASWALEMGTLAEIVCR